ncbi:MAG TPA: hypothetical protein VGN28_11850 [Blastococcus sp.]|nr:hypothetical protein [Blastococcus sp.]
MTTTRARKTGPTSQEISLRPATATVAAAAPTSSSSHRGMTPAAGSSAKDGAVCGTATTEGTEPTRDRRAGA